MLPREEGSGAGMRFQILGDLSVWDDSGERLSVPGPTRRALLAVLLLHANKVLTADRLIDELWGERAPATAAKSLQVHIWRLRKAFGSDENGPLVTEGRGYLLRVGPDELDLEQFDRLLAEGRAALREGRAEHASAVLGQALKLWHGSPLSEFVNEPFARGARTTLEELHLEALESRIDADLELGRHRALVAELETLVGADPLRERLRAQLMLALYRCGRQAEALAVYRDARRLLDEELGLEPGRELRELERAVLNQDPALDLPATARQGVDEGRVGERRGALHLRRLLAAGLALAGVATAALLLAAGGAGGSFHLAGNSVAVLDVGSGRVVGQIPVGARPSQLSVGDGSLWVANLGDGTISQIDPRTRQVTRTLAVGQSAQSSVAGVAAGGDVFWTLDGGDVARRIDLESDTVRTTNVGTPFGAPFTGRWVDGPHTVALDRTGAWFLGVSSVARLDLRSGALRDHIAVGTNPASLATGYGSVWVTDSADDTVSRIDESSGAVIQTIPVGHEPSGIATGAGAVWVADTADDTVERIDPQTGAITDAIPVAGGPRGVAVGDGSVWVADSKGGAVSRIDPASRRVVATIPFGQSPEDLAVVGKSVFVSVQPGDVRFVSAGGGLRLRVVTQTDPLPSTDPALGYVDQLGFQLAYLTCATLLTHPDRPSPVGERLVPEVARAMPTVSAGGRIYTFYIRSGFRFSPPSGAPVTAQAFVRAIERALNARMNSYWGTLIEDVVGARAYSAGHASSVAGLSASANRLTIRLTAPAPQFLASISTLGFCAVPPTTPINPHGVEGIPDAGPYYVASRVPGQRLVLKRNPYYPGSRPRRVAEIDVNIGAAGGKAVRQVLSGADDYAPSVAPDRVAALESRYGAASAAARAGGQQYFENPTPTVDYLALNTRRALFARTALRRAVNFAIDRRALASEAVRALSDAGAQPTAQYLPPTLPGYTPAAIYPLGGPDLKVARRLARGGRGQGVIYTYTEPPGPELAQIIKQNLQGIGIQMEIKQFGKPQLYQRLLNPAEPWDIALVSFAADYPDPFDFLNLLFDSSHISPSANPPFGQYNNWSRFSSPVYDRRLHAASLLTGAGRLRTYGQLAISLARDAAPMAAWGAETSRDLFAAGIGCQIFQPVYGYDLSTLCRRTQHRV